MAWPCITRACCINRFWTELDKADIAVPLVFTKYSDVTDVQRLQHHHPQPKHRETREEPPAAEEAPPAPGAAAAKDGSAASVMRQDFQAWRVRPEPSCKPRNEYQPPPAPFINETQYQKDYKPWPIPRKHDHPWIPKPSPAATSGPEKGAGAGRPKRRPAEAESSVEKSEIEEKIQEKEVKKEAEEQQRKGRAAADAVNRQIKEVMSTSSSYR